MVNQSISNHFANLINQSLNVIHHSSNQIRDMYPDNAVCLLEYIDKNSREYMLESRFDNENATLTCTFDNQGNCDVAYLFFDEIQEISAYTEFLNSKYDYDYLKKYWIISSNKYLALKKAIDDICFMVFE